MGLIMEVFGYNNLLGIVLLLAAIALILFIIGRR